MLINSQTIMAKVPALFEVPERTYVDADGNAVSASDPKRLTLVAAAGTRIPMAQAQSLGIADDDGNAVEISKAKKKKAPEAENKQAAKPENKSAK